MGTRGQQGVELMAIFAAALALFIIFYGIFAQQYGESVRMQAQSDGVRIADTLAQEISIAARAGDGYSRRVEYPQKLAGAITYSLELNNVSGSVDIVATLGPNNVFTYNALTATRNITGEPRYVSPHGYYLEIARGVAYIENHGGLIVVNQTRAVT